MDAIRITNLVKKYGTVLAVENLSLAVRAGTMFGFLGPNGSGKSTTIGCMTGLLDATSGQIELLGQPFGLGDVDDQPVPFGPAVIQGAWRGADLHPADFAADAHAASRAVPAPPTRVLGRRRGFAAATNSGVRPPTATAGLGDRVLFRRSHHRDFRPATRPAVRRRVGLAHQLADPDRDRPASVMASCFVSPAGRTDWFPLKPSAVSSSRRTRACRGKSAAGFFHFLI